MKIAVRYFTLSGNTKRLADAIAGALGAEALPMSVPLTEPVDLLFLGASVYAGGVSAEVKTAIAQWSPSLVAKVAVFSTAALVKSAYPQVKKLLARQEISLMNEQFYCRGQFKCIHKGRPNQTDIEAAVVFAKQITNI